MKSKCCTESTSVLLDVTTLTEKKYKTISLNLISINFCRLTNNPLYKNILE